MKKLKCGTMLWIIVTITALYPHSLIYLYKFFTLHPCIKYIMGIITLYILLLEYCLFLCKQSKKYK